MTDDRLAQIEARVEAATPGPWEDFVLGSDDTARVRSIAPDMGPLRGSDNICWVGDRSMPLVSEDAEFIAHAREDVRYLLDRVREAERIAAAYKNAAADYADAVDAKDDAEAERDAALATLQEIEALHQPDGADDCLLCGYESGWPCATLSILARRSNERTDT